MFSFLASVYGTDVHVASCPDESNISFFSGHKTMRVYDGAGLFAKFLIHSHIIIISGASKSPLLVFYVGDVLGQKSLPSLARVEEQNDNMQVETQDPLPLLCDVLPSYLEHSETWLVTTEINFGGLLRKAKKSKGMVRIIVDEIDTICNEQNKKDPAKLASNHFIHVCDCSMPELGKELTQDEGGIVVEAPKVIVSAGD